MVHLVPGAVASEICVSNFNHAVFLLTDLLILFIYFLDGVIYDIFICNNAIKIYLQCSKNR